MMKERAGGMGAGRCGPGGGSYSVPSGSGEEPFFAIEFELVSGERDGGIQDWFQC